MKPKRKAVSKRARFEVFKRDKFSCQYCGKKSPDAILHIDHIEPVAKGGSNHLTNLITSCADCNLGKGAKRLSDDTAVSKQRNELEAQQERISQIELMAKWKMSLLDADAAAVNACCDMISSISESTPSDSGKKNLGKWIRKHGLSLVMDSIPAAFDRYYKGDDETWEKAFVMIPKIASIKGEPEWKQDALKYSCFAKKNGYTRASDKNLFRSLMRADPELMSTIDYKSLLRGRMGLREYCEAIMHHAGLVYDEGEVQA